jgi:RimJ/RimL family protein N-acetyltransferase
MTRLIVDRPEELAQWAEAMLPEQAPFARPLTAIGIVSSENEIMGVAIYNNFRQNDIEITFVTATPKWATPGNVRAILSYPFVQLGVDRMTAITSKTNKKARKLLDRLGFKLEGIHPFAYAGKTACTYGLYLDNARKWVDG